MMKYLTVFVPRLHGVLKEKRRNKSPDPKPHSGGYVIDASGPWATDGHHNDASILRNVGDFLSTQKANTARIISIANPMRKKRR